MKSSIKSSIKQVNYWYNGLTGNVEWVVEYKSGRNVTYQKNKLPKTVQKWLGEDSTKLAEIGDTGTGHWHTETYREKEN